MREDRCHVVLSYCDRPTPILTSIKTSLAKLQGVLGCVSYQTKMRFLKYINKDSASNFLLIVRSIGRMAFGYFFESKDNT